MPLDLPGRCTAAVPRSPRSRHPTPLTTRPILTHNVPRTLRLTLAYDGSGFSGWQTQPHRRTVQSVVEAAIARVTGESPRVVAAGRTDAGVHALGQAASVVLCSRLDNATLLRAVNAYLPDDVSLLDLADAPDGFHAIDHARGKRYRYLIQDGPRRELFLRRYAWRVWQQLDVAAMQSAATALQGTHDFRSFQNEGSPRVSTVRTVRELTVRRRRAGPSLVVAMDIEADGFLYNMVRNIAGTLVQVGQGKQPVDWPAFVLAARDRTAAGMCAPPHALYLVRVLYD
jgi:tRNA pseudouridine38-40 synthase